MIDTIAQLVRAVLPNSAVSKRARPDAGAPAAQENPTRPVTDQASFSPEAQRLARDSDATRSAQEPVGTPPDAVSPTREAVSPPQLDLRF